MPRYDYMASYVIIDAAKFFVIAAKLGQAFRADAERCRRLSIGAQCPRSNSGMLPPHARFPRPYAAMTFISLYRRPTFVKYAALSQLRRVAAGHLQSSCLRAGRLRQHFRAGLSRIDFGRPKPLQWPRVSRTDTFIKRPLSD